MYLRIYVYMDNVIVWLEHAQCLRGRGREWVVDATCDLRNKTPPRLRGRAGIGASEEDLNPRSLQLPGDSGTVSPALQLGCRDVYLIAG